MSDESTQLEAEAPETETPETDNKTFSADYVKQLREEAAAYRTQKNTLESKLQEYEDRDKTELEKLQERAQRAEQELEKASIEQTRLTVAAKHGIAADHLDLLTGSTEEEIAAKAEKLASLITARKPERVLVAEQGEPAPPALNGDGIEDALKRALRIN